VSRRDDSPGSPEKAPTRIPGQGGIELESSGGSIRLESLELHRAEPVADSAATSEPVTPERRRRRLWRREPPGALEGKRYKPGERVPVSGVYNVLDESGRYLKRQVTCHVDSSFPPGHKKDTPRRYELAYRAIHLVPEEGDVPYPAEIYLPGDTVRISGIYDVVDRDGHFLHYQRALIEDKETFDPLDDPKAYGYMLAFRARHLHQGPDHG